MLSPMIITTRSAELSIASADGAVPPTINYKGVLADASGTPIATTTSLVFTIYDQPVLGSVKWTETRDLTSDAEGRFTVILGQTTPLLDFVFEPGPYYLGVELAGGAAQTSRVVITSMSSARQSSTINRVAEVLSNKSGSVMGVRDPGGNIGDVGNVMGVRDPGGNIGEAESTS